MDNPSWSMKIEVDDDEDDEAANAPPQNPSGNDSTEAVQDHCLYGYNKKKILQHFLVNGFHAQSLATVLTKYKLEADTSINYFNKQAKLAQDFVHEECSSLSFENVSAWLKLFQEVGLNTRCNYEPALVVKAIADNEVHPAPQELGGIDLTAIYKFIGNSLLGMPQPQLNTESARFLADEFESLINDVNTDLADAETRHMKQCLEHNINENESSLVNNALNGRLSLDPLSLDHDIDNLL